MLFSYGYFIAKQNLLCGEPKLATEAQVFYSTTLGLDTRYAELYDGVSIYSQADGNWIVRVVLRNFFKEKFEYVVHDYPYLWEDSL